MARHFNADDAGRATSPEDTGVRWDPIPDDEWAVDEVLPEDDSGTDDAGSADDANAAAAAEEWLNPTATVVRPRATGPATSHSWTGPAGPGDTAPGPRVTSAPMSSTGESGAPGRPRTTGKAAAGGPPRRRKPARHGCLSALLWLVMLVVAGVMALRCLPADLSNGRVVPELASFVPLLVVPILACLVLAALWRRRVLLVACVAALAVMGWWHRGYLIPGERVSDEARAAVAASASADDSAARIMTLNTKNGGASAEEVVELVRAQNVEILCLQEINDDFVAALREAGLEELLPYYVISDGASAVSNGGRNGIWTLAPMENVSGNLLPIETSSMPAGTVTVGDRAIRVVSVHPNSPVRGAQDLWDRGLSVIGSLAGYDHAYLIMGDFNSTWDHARFRELLGSSFVDAGETAGEGFHMTYPSDGLPSLIEIDHIVYARNSGIVVSDLETVEVGGTDHRALLGTLEVA